MTDNSYIEGHFQHEEGGDVTEGMTVDIAGAVTGIERSPFA